jgi:hypothetical protein
MTALRLVLINRFFPGLGLNEKSTASEFTASFARDTNWKTIVSLQATSSLRKRLFSSL